MSYTNCTIRQYETGERTIRKLNDGTYVLIVCFPFESEPYANDEWRKAHAVHASYGRGNSPKVFRGFGQAWEYGNKHFPNCKPVPRCSLPLATGDKVTEDMIDDVPVH